MTYDKFTFFSVIYMQIFQDQISPPQSLVIDFQPKIKALFVFESVPEANRLFLFRYHWKGRHL
jgi:hypothetical protein